MSDHSAIRRYKSHTPHIGKHVFVDDAAVVIGQVELGDEVSIWPCAVIRGDMHFIRIGARSNVLRVSDQSREETQPKGVQAFLPGTTKVEVYSKSAGVWCTASVQATDETVGTVTVKQVREIAEAKMKDLNATDVEAAMKIILGSASSMGIEVK